MERKNSRDLIANEGDRLNRCNPEHPAAMAGDVGEERSGGGTEVMKETVLESKAWSDR